MTSTASLPADLAGSSKFAAFNAIDHSYKEVNGVSIQATLLVPKEPKTGKHPIILKHARMTINRFPAWILELAIREDAIIVTPDYRLMPEINGLDILDDVRDFYDWMSKLDSILPHFGTDLNDILVTGESAGGWLALQSALLPSTKGKISAVIAQYPMIDMRDRYYTEEYEKKIFNLPVPPPNQSILEDYMANMQAGKTIPSAIPPDRTALVGSSLHRGLYAKWLGNDSRLYPIEMLDSVKDLPPIWLLHGKSDSVIPVEGTYKFEEALKDKHVEAELHVTYAEGDHGFDLADGIDLQTDWVREGMLFIDRHWPKQ